ncbi:MAG: hypothetical protein EHM34_08665 [Nitrosopumilales archaeon]|nr:MAG: hypothetical protein EHM34_08665 [Nitrosopumilales archaeon]
MDRNIKEILKTLDKIVVSPEQLAYWTSAIETTAKSMCDVESGKINFSYSVDKKSMEFFVKDAKSRDCLVKSIEIHLPLIPESIQGYFSVFKYDLKNMKFDGKNTPY